MTAPPNARFVGGLDLIVKMVQDDVIDELIPCKDGRDLIEAALPDFHPELSIK